MMVNLLLTRWMKDLEKIFYGNVVAYNAAMLPEARQDEQENAIWRNVFSDDGSPMSNDAASSTVQNKGVNIRPYESKNGEDGSSSFPKGMSSVNFLSVEDELKDSVKAAHYHSKVNIENEILCSYVIQELTQPRKEHVPSICSKSSGLKPSHMKQMSDGNNITYAELFTSEATVVDSGMDIKDLGQDGSSCVQFNAVEHSSSLPFSLASVLVGLAKQFGGASNTRPKIDIQLLLNAMDNLSEFLLSSCSNDVEALKEQDREVICRVVNNLDACLSKKVGLMRSMPQIQFPESSTCCLRKPTDPEMIKRLYFLETSFSPPCRTHYPMP
ncbi:uncharacterized protein LOC122066501 isoform X2 [Macadamia integrifolia]|uniref:uncharacterized protein LOC122066501 isoform X2 n=1 Tax=Macadamia integrifolia TaxID=60698 RepID=UPI001C4F2FA6|nr:uncharacterized protein LOC122066501 isoform X2 [Macadamia integrifolia]XP_042486280.1 uncharacterized protein LOC122066501 isoform X2 [Macadamia integrifolia]